MQTKIRNLLIASILAVTLGGGAALACDRHDGLKRHDGAPMLFKAVRHLDNLTDEQRAQLRKLYDEHRDARYEQYKQSRDERRALHDALRDGAAPEAIKPLAQKQGERVAQRIVERAQMMAQVRAILTDAQIQQLKEMAAQRGADGDRGERGMGRW